jgi:flagellar biosynthesis chaperone FliJ
MSKKRVLNIERLGALNEKLADYISLYMSAPDHNEAKLEKLIKLRKKIAKKLRVLLCNGFSGWTEESQVLQRKLQRNNHKIDSLIQDITRLKRHMNNTAEVLGLVDSALEIAAGIAAKCAAA